MEKQTKRGPKTSGAKKLKKTKKSQPCHKAKPIESGSLDKFIQRVQTRSVTSMASGGQHTSDPEDASVEKQPRVAWIQSANCWIPNSWT